MCGADISGMRKCRSVGPNGSDYSCSQLDYCQQGSRCQQRECLDCRSVLSHLHVIPTPLWTPFRHMVPQGTLGGWHRHFLLWVTRRLLSAVRTSADCLPRIHGSGRRRSDDGRPDDCKRHRAASRKRKIPRHTRTSDIIAAHKPHSHQLRGLSWP